MIEQLEDTDLSNPKERDELICETAWALSNMTSGGNAATIEYFFQDSGAFDPFVGILTDETVKRKIVNVVVEGLNNVLRWGQNVSTADANLVVQYMTANGMVE